MNIFGQITKKTMLMNKSRTIVTIIGVILATAMVTAVVTLGTSIQKFMYDYSVQTDGNWHVAAKGISQEELRDMKQDKEVKELNVMDETGYAKLDSQKDNVFNQYLYIQSIDEQTADMMSMKLKEGRLPENENEIILYDTIPINGDEQAKIGDQITLDIGDRMIEGERLLFNAQLEYGYDENGDFYLLESFQPRYTHTYKVVGILEHWGDTQLNGAGTDAFIGKGGSQKTVSNAYLCLKNPKETFNFIQKYEGGSAALIANTGMLKWLGVSGNATAMGMINGLLTILIIIIGVGAVSLIYNAFSISLRERTTQFGLLSSIGATRKQLRRSMWYEAFWVGIIGIPIGILSGLAGIGITLFFIGESLAKWIRGAAAGGIRLATSPGAIFLAASVAAVIIAVSVWIPAARVKRITPIEAIRANKDIKVKSKEVKSPKFIRKIFGLEGMLADKNYRRDRKKYRATVFSLTVSIVLFTSATLFSKYLSKTGAFMLEAPEYEFQYQIIEEETGEEGRKEIQKLLESGEKVTDVVSYGEFSATIALDPQDVSSKAEEILGNIPSLSEYYFGTEEEEAEGEKEKSCTSITGLILPDEEFEKLAKDEGIDAKTYMQKENNKVLYYDFYRHYDNKESRYVKTEMINGKKDDPIKADLLMSFGKLFENDDMATAEQIQDSKKEIVLAHKVQKLPEYFNDWYNPFILLLIPESQKDTIISSIDADLTYSCMIKSSEYQKTYEDLCEKLENGDQNGMVAERLMNLAQQYEQDRGIMIAIRVLSYGFIILISLIAAANVFNTISTNIMIRKREFAMLKSMGMGEKSMRRMMNYECLIYGIRSIFYGVILSVAISFAMNYVVMTGADVAFQHPWGGLCVAVLWVFAVVFATMLYSMSKIKKQNIIEELKKD